MTDRNREFFAQNYRAAKRLAKRLHKWFDEKKIFNRDLPCCSPKRRHKIYLRFELRKSIATQMEDLSSLIPMFYRRYQ
jgi:hypothetical protein